MNKKLEEILANHRFHCDRYYLKNGNFQYCRHGNYFCSDAIAIKEAFAAGENSYLPCSKAGCVKHASCCDDCEKKAEQKGRQEVFDAMDIEIQKRLDDGYEPNGTQWYRRLKEKFGVK